jgi:GT2 family glycosyltransferase
MTPRVSVVMPCFNAAPFVEQAVRSALGQTCDDSELIVIDDGSTDGSGAIVERLQEEYGERLVLLRSDRTGPYPARNAGLARARGEWVAFLDADDWWEPDFLQSMLAAAREAGADVAYCGWKNVGGERDRTLPYVPPDYVAEDAVAAFLRDCPWPIHAALVRREVLTKLGGFSTRMFSSMDYDLWIRLLAVTRRMVRVPRVLAYYRWHGGGQISAVKWRQVLHAWRVRRDFVQHNPALVAHLSRSVRRRLVDGVLLEQGKTLFWRRDLEGAQPLLRQALCSGAFGARDLPLLVAAQLPGAVFQRLVAYADRRHA